MYYLRKNYNFHKMVCTYSTSTYLIEITIGKVSFRIVTLSNVGICTVRRTTWKFIHLLISSYFTSTYLMAIKIWKVSFCKMTLSNVGICTERRTTCKFIHVLYKNILAEQNDQQISFRWTFCSANILSYCPYF